MVGGCLFSVYCLVLIVHGLLGILYCLRFVVLRGVLCVCYLIHVVRCSIFAIRYSMFAIRYPLFAIL